MYLLSVFFTCCSQIITQAFNFESKYGIVDTVTLHEIATPKYEKFLPIFEDVLAFFNKNLIYFFDEKTGETTNYFFKDHLLELNENRDLFYHCLLNGKSVLISTSRFSDKIFYEKEYLSMQSYYGFIIGKTFNNTFDVYKKGAYSNPFLKDLSASFFAAEDVLDIKNNTEKKIFIFYGMDSISFYDTNFELLNQLESKEISYSKIEIILEKE